MEENNYRAKSTGKRTYREVVQGGSGGFRKVHDGSA
jgi:hypothetical protein